MWLFTQRGFFSLTRSSDDPKKMQLRARSRTDLEEAMRTAAIPAKDWSIIATPIADYPYRIILTPAQAKKVTAALTAEIDYSNFKGRVQTIDTQRDKMPALHDIWQIMRDWQEGGEGTTVRKETPFDWNWYHEGTGERE
jgi:hypothetical protein